jgi:prepilin-type N-terminal cleavage/methylation domain-containing protein
MLQNKTYPEVKEQKGFSLVEILVVIAIIGVIATIILMSLGGATAKARDAKRKTTLSQIGRVFSLSCFMPQAGAGEYDIATFMPELKARYPQYAAVLNSVKDPKVGTDSETFYRYIVSDDGKACAVYANLENKDEAVTLKNISTATPKGGTGVYQALAAGPNGTNKYFQVSN